jgi:hypothetical protein
MGLGSYLSKTPVSDHGIKSHHDKSHHGKYAKTAILQAKTPIDQTHSKVSEWYRLPCSKNVQQHASETRAKQSTLLERSYHCWKTDSCSFSTHTL